MRYALYWLMLFCIGSVAAATADAPPPGFNVHTVITKDGHVMWRGGAPRRDTVEALVGAARKRHVTVTFIDLRAPATDDDRSGKDGRLSPADERHLAAVSGMQYVSISALDHALLTVINQHLARGDVYIHCMYGVNRTGFAVGRYATANRCAVTRDGLGTRDWRQGEAFEKAFEASGNSATAHAAATVPKENP